MKNWLNYNEYSLRPKVGDIRATTVDNVNLDKEIILTAEKQFLDSSVSPELYAKDSFKGASGILSLTNPVDGILENDNQVKVNNILIKKNANEIYLVGNVKASNNYSGHVYKITNGDFANAVKIIDNLGTPNRFQVFLPCFRGDDLHIVYGDSVNIRYYIYDTLNNVVKLNETVVSTGLYPTSIRYIESKDEVVFTVTNVANNTRIYSVVNDSSFTLQNSEGIQSKQLRNNKTMVRCDTHGTNNFYDNKLWFYSQNGSLIFSFDVNTYAYTLEKDISTERTIANDAPYTYCQVTENGTFYFLFGTDETLNQVQIFAAKNGDLVNSSVVTQDVVDFTIGTYLQLMDDSSALLKTYTASLVSDIIRVTYDLDITTNPFSVLTNLNAGTDVTFTATKNTDKLYIVYPTSPTAANDLRYIELDMTESSGALIIPEAPLTLSNQYVFTIRKEI